MEADKAITNTLGAECCLPGLSQIPRCSNLFKWLVSCPAICESAEGTFVIRHVGASAYAANAQRVQNGHKVCRNLGQVFRLKSSGKSVEQHQYNIVFTLALSSETNLRILSASQGIPSDRLVPGLIPLLVFGCRLPWSGSRLKFSSSCT